MLFSIILQMLFHKHTFLYNFFEHYHLNVFFSECNSLKNCKYMNAHPCLRRALWFVLQLPRILYFFVQICHLKYQIYPWNVIEAISLRLHLQGFPHFGWNNFHTEYKLINTTSDQSTVYNTWTYIVLKFYSNTT